MCIRPVAGMKIRINLPETLRAAMQNCIHHRYGEVVRCGKGHGDHRNVVVRLDDGREVIVPAMCLERAVVA